ncbi:uncharacterized protein LOC115626839 [Scaptodrosophila lebanonensis]|uniref:Uncharacterized protein LOC115626839 n=1 Tax=Drosophila lebanonensis TaxID=7225 RepID=A0A6J2TQ68_DROLE|nr:uncharacterized protein LOC115626839 [Scaptodrosophila lebanonensis]
MEREEKKRARQVLSESIDRFLEEHASDMAVQAESFATECCGQILNDFDEQTHEAWIVQIPRGMDPSSLAGKRIKVPGRRTFDNIQVRSAIYSQPLRSAIGYVNPKEKYKLCALPLSGSIVLSNQQDMEEPQKQEPDTFPEAGEPPTFNVIVSHPLFGRDYKKRIEVPKKIAKVLREADQTSAKCTAQLRRTANYYKTRNALQTTTKTLKQKEIAIRKTVVTGVSPNLNQTYDSFNGGEYETEKDVDNILSLIGDSDDDVVVKNEPDSPPSKKIKKHKAEKKSAVIV